MQPNGTMAVGFALLPTTLATPGGHLDPVDPLRCPAPGDYDVTAFAYDTAGQQDVSTSGATARYRVFPGDSAPVVIETLLAPSDGTTFTESRIFISGRFEDNLQMAKCRWRSATARADT